MKAHQFRVSIDELYKRLLALTQTKGEEYKGEEDNQFANFEREAAENSLTREQILMVFLSKHLNSIRTYVADHARGRIREYAEPISGRIDDAILYLLLLRGMAVENDQKLHACRIDEARVLKNYTLNPNPKECPPGYIPLDAEAPKRTVLDHLRSFKSALLPVGVPIKYPMTNIGMCPIKIEPAPCRTEPAHEVWLSRIVEDARDWCRNSGGQPAVSALSTVDQLYGLKAPTIVHFLHHGTTADENLYSEVERRCEQQGLTLSLVAL